jgi:hypothetical protein
MHLQELFRCIEEKRTEFIAKRAAKDCLAGSTAGVFSPGENKGEKSPNEKIEAVLTEVEVTAGK